MFAVGYGEKTDLSGNYANLVLPSVESHVLAYEEDGKTGVVDLIDGNNGFLAISHSKLLKHRTIAQIFNEAEKISPTMKGLIFEVGSKNDYPTTVSRYLYTRDQDFVFKISKKLSPNSSNLHKCYCLEDGICFACCPYPFFQSAQEIAEFLNK